MLTPDGFGVDSCRQGIASADRLAHDDPMTNTTTTSPSVSIFTLGDEPMPDLTVTDLRRLLDLVRWQENGTRVGLLGDGFVIEGVVTRVYVNGGGVCANIHGDNGDFHCGALNGAVVVEIVEVVIEEVQP